MSRTPKQIRTAHLACERQCVTFAERLQRDDPERYADRIAKLYEQARHHATEAEHAGHRRSGGAA